MKVFRNFFENELDRLLAEDNFLGSRDPQKLLRELKSPSSLKKLQKNFEAVTENPYKILKMLAIANILIMYSKDFFSFVEQHFKWKGGNDEWLRTKFIQPYFKFLIRSCTSKQMYIACRTLKIRKQDALQTLFYCINMLKLLFKVVEKMPFLGRYYKQKNEASVGMAMEIIALQAQKLYRAFQFLLEDILRQKQYYIRTVQDEAMMRGIFMDQLSTINEQMTKLFLDKYFSPISKGINVKVFRPEEHGLDCDKIFRSIAINRQSALRKSQRSSIQKSLFPESGKVNLAYYQQALTTPTNRLTSSQKSCSFRETLTAKDFNTPNLLTLPDQKRMMGSTHDKMYKSNHSTRSTTITSQLKGYNI